MRRLVRSTAILGLGSAATVVAAILRAKILAAWLGPEGTGVLAQLAALTAVLVPIASLGAGNGLTKLIAEGRARGDLARVRAVERTATALAWIVGGALAILALAFAPALAEAVYRDRGFAWAVVLGALSVPFSAVASLRLSMLQGHQAVGALATVNALVAAAGVASIVPLAHFFGVRGAVIQLVIVAFVYVALSARALRGVWGDHLALRDRSPETRSGRGREPWIDRSLLPVLARYGGSALLVILSSTLTVLFLRSILVGKLGLSANGIYQVCIGVSGLTMPLILNSITASVWPEIAAQRTDQEAVGSISSAVRLGFLLATTTGALLLAGASIWIPILYSRAFMPAADLLPFQFLGDYFRTGAWMIGIWVVPRERLRPWVLFDIVYGVTLLVLFIAFVDHLGLKTVVLAYVAAHMTHALLHYAFARRAIGFRLGPDNRKLLLASLALLLLLALLRPRDSLGVALGLLAFGAWAAVVVRPREWRGLWDMAGRVLGRPRPSGE